jgi:hypothetical protein
MAPPDDRRPSHDIVQDDIVGRLTVDVCSLSYFTADRLLVTRVHRASRSLGNVCMLALVGVFGAYQPHVIRGHATHNTPILPETLHI